MASSISNESKKLLSAGEKVDISNMQKNTTTKPFAKASAIMASNPQKFAENVKSYDLKNIEKNISIYKKGACFQFKLDNFEGKNCDDETILASITKEFCPKVMEGKDLAEYADSNSTKLFCGNDALTHDAIENLDNLDAYSFA